jgi:hypothetical protein
MRYTVQKLDGRFSHKHLFSYYIGFSNRMNQDQGPLEFSRAQQWFSNTYGWSAEIRIYENIYEWAMMDPSVPMMRVTGGWARRPPKTPPDVCNTHWSWTNGYNDLRIYTGEKELTMFQLKFKLD